MSGRCKAHLYSRTMQAGSRGVCVRCGAEQPLRGIVSGPGPRVQVLESTSEGANPHLKVRPRMVREFYDDGA